MTRDKLTNSQEVDMDIRFLLANERTLLAWIRTGLALQAGGFALAHFSDGSRSGEVAGILAIVFGGVMAVIGYSRFRAADKAIRKGELPRQGLGPTLEVGIVVFTAIVLAFIEAWQG